MSRRILALLAAALPLSVVAGAPTTSVADPSTPPTTLEHATTWQRIAMRTVFTEGGSAPPAGSLYIGFTSLAVDDAVRTSNKRGHSSAVAALATAAHDVLLQYFPASRANLDADLAATLAWIPDGPRENKGIRIGRNAAAEMIASRVGDGRNDASIVYSKPPAIGIWQPAPGGVMAAAWLGFVDPLVLDDPVELNGPDPLTSADYATDYNEVRRLGSTASTERTQEQTDIANFFALNQFPIYRDALCRHLEATGELNATAAVHLFALIDASVADAFIQTWRLKYDVGYWRPFQAIANAGADGNDATLPEDGWVPLVPNPAYSDYTSGHAAATSPFAEIVRMKLGNDTPLELRAPNGLVRPYATLSALEHDAFHARIWGGLHFRDAMDDGYFLGHETARRVAQMLG